MLIYCYFNKEIYINWCFVDVMKIHPTPMHICKYQENVTEHVIVTYTHMQIPRKPHRTCYCYLCTYANTKKTWQNMLSLPSHIYANTKKTWQNMLLLPKHICKYQENLTELVIVTYAHMQIPRKRDRTCYCYLHRYARTVLNKNIQKYEPTVST